MNIIQRIKDGANRATEKAQGAVEVNKLNGQIAEIEKEMSFHFTGMGRIFYEGYASGDMSVAETEMMNHAKECDKLQEEIDELRGRIGELKNERICTCGQVVNLDANFCPACGRKLVPGEAIKKRSETVKPAGPEKRYQDEINIEQAYPEQAYAEKAYAEQAYAEKPYAEKPYTGSSSYHDEPQASTPVEEAYEYVEEESWDEPSEANPLDSERERRQADEFERERERQLELDRRIRYWKENNQSGDETESEEGIRDTVKCQICRADLPKGSKWCPRCGAEQI
ncbi:zinc ribbon domain-containing protein [Paenibacillus pini]|uniref:Zinc-ribbon domain-containing protein n=1 Tax=Paenibacillus pini JCM 16418 TaxID=1236976 RepID=W7YXW8_9BACL|nr:zinc ribbon domain-containing protein [Paenibacillus pini]GAF09521.1 hypothetical protein JCM16418_3664 [Paenibacillus pini JCM 16418]